MKILGYIIGVLIAFALMAGIALLIAFPIKWTWNVTMPYLFALPTITWGKAWCLYFLANCLIKNNTSTLKGK